MSTRSFGGKEPYEENNLETSQELTPDPFSDAPHPVRVHLSRSTMRATPGKRSKLHRETPRNGSTTR